MASLDDDKNLHRKNTGGRYHVDPVPSGRMKNVDTAPMEDGAVRPKSNAKRADEKEVNPDAKLVSMMGLAMLDKGGMKTIEQALASSQDPGQVVAQFVAQMAGRLAEYTATEMGINPGVYAQPHGFVDQVLGHIERKLGLPKEFSDSVYGETMEVMKAAAMSPEQAQQGQQPQQQAAPAPGPAAPTGLDQGVM
jgi:hypothetical protein